MSAPSDEAPTRIGNRYRLDQRIGAGAMGAVWRGTDELLNRTVAVKELLAAAEPRTPAGGDALEESRQRLMREGLGSPHVDSRVGGALDPGQSRALAQPEPEETGPRDHRRVVRRQPSGWREHAGTERLQARTHRGHERLVPRDASTQHDPLSVVLFHRSRRLLDGASR